MTSAQVDKTSVTNNNSFQKYSDQTITQYEPLHNDSLGFKPFYYVTDLLTDGWMDVWMDGQTNRQTDWLIEPFVYNHHGFYHLNKQNNVLYVGIK